MKKVFLFLSVSLLLFVSGCRDIWTYGNENKELYSVAVYSLLGVPGNFADSVKVIEEDSYGRIMFLHLSNEAHAYSELGDFYSLIITQKSDDKYAYYYENYNFLISTKGGTKDIYKLFNKEDIDALKEKNDWNKEINDNLLSKVEITNKKSTGKINSQTQEEAFFNLVPKKYDNYIKIVFLNTDQYGRHIYFVREVDKSITDEHMNKNAYLMILYEDGTYDDNTYIYEITDLLNYQDELANFKQINNWNKPVE